MIELIINGQTAVLPEDFSGELVFENPYFTKTSNYSLDIELPMPANNHIYKNIHRIYTDKSKLIYPAVLRDFRGDIINGSAVLLFVDDSCVKVQLVSGNAEFNLLTNESILDELDLGTISYPPWKYDSFISSTEKYKYYGSVDQIDAVWLPVSYQEDKLYNDVGYEFGTNNFVLRPFSRSSCIQPYLLTEIGRAHV